MAIWLGTKVELSTYRHTHWEAFYGIHMDWSAKDDISCSSATKTKFKRMPIGDIFETALRSISSIPEAAHYHIETF